MSDASNSHDDGPHEGPIRTPKQLIVAVLFSFILPVIVIVMLASYVTDDKKPAAGSDGLEAAAVASRIAPVGKVSVKDMSNPATMKTGEQVFAAQCSACHAAGLAGAPKFGDAAAWGPRVTQGYEALLNSALKGKNAMGAQGGGDFSDFEVGRAVVYMANHGGAQFPEPKFAAPAGAAEAAPAAAPAPAPVAAEAPPAETQAAAPVAAPVVVAAAAPAAAAGAEPALYTQACSVCHAAGIAGAPKFGDKAAWAPRIVAGVDGLTASAIKGKNAMPPRGGTQGSDADIKAVVAYMVSAVK
ncbi:MAG: c-type cytochrome [Rhizobacter sp.]